MIRQGERVVDELGTVYELEKELGCGGQGAVFAVKGGRRAVKILLDRSPTCRDRLKLQLRTVRMLFDIRELAIATPLEMLQPPFLGYVMELLTGMVPISKLINVPRNTDCIVEWYLNGGGLRRRLLLLARCAETLSQLHGRGLVYTDPSPNNIFVSSDADANEIRLIDADNLHYERSSSINCYTPGFGAPELVTRRSGADTLTDAYAFAVIAFQTLALVHPLMGDKVDQGEPELETLALQGELPWIDHPEDTCNSTSRGFPREIVLSPRLRELCHKCFGAGLREPIQRPGIAQWTEKLYSAADFTIYCPNCNSTYYANQECCSWCNHARPTYVQIRIQRWEPLHNFSRKQPLHLLTLESSEPLILTSRIVNGRTGINSHIHNIELVFANESIAVRSLNGQCFWLTSEGTQRVEREVRDRWVRFPAEPGNYGSWLLHFGNFDYPHRLATFNLIRGENP